MEQLKAFLRGEGTVGVRLSGKFMDDHLGTLEGPEDALDGRWMNRGRVWVGSVTKEQVRNILSHAHARAGFGLERSDQEAAKRVIRAFSNLGLRYRNGSVEHFGEV